MSIFGGLEPAGLFYSLLMDIILFSKKTPRALIGLDPSWALGKEYLAGSAPLCRAAGTHEWTHTHARARAHTCPTGSTDCKQPCEVTREVPGVHPEGPRRCHRISTGCSRPSSIPTRGSSAGTVDTSRTTPQNWADTFLGAKAHSQAAPPSSGTTPGLLFLEPQGSSFLPRTACPGVPRSFKPSGGGRKVDRKGLGRGRFGAVRSHPKP